ncbi:MAG: hypothetical protein GY838_17300 [bacterium]|nr:hypothetical protein [bacterium]
MQERKSMPCGPKRLAILILAAATVSWSGQSLAQVPTLVENIADLELPTLEGPITTHYSEGFADRAAHLQEIVAAADGYLRQEATLGVQLDLHLAVLDAEDWARWTPLPYGLAHMKLGESPTAVVAATPDNMLVNATLANKDRVSEETVRLLDELGFTYEEAVPAFMDLVAVHEIGHIYSNAYDVWPTQKWLSEFTATYLSYSFMKDSRPEFVQLWEIMSESNVETNDHDHTTLADFEKLYIGVGGSNYGWYQARFTQQVCRVYEAAGIAFMHHVRKSLAEHPEAAEDDPFRLHELDRIAEGFVAWAPGATGDLR